MTGHGRAPWRQENTVRRTSISHCGSVGKVGIRLQRLEGRRSSGSLGKFGEERDQQGRSRWCQTVGSAFRSTWDCETSSGDRWSSCAGGDSILKELTTMTDSWSEATPRWRARRQWSGFWTATLVAVDDTTSQGCARPSDQLGPGRSVRGAGQHSPAVRNRQRLRAER